MLKIEVKGIDLFDEKTNQFLSPKTTILQLEHSLISLSKWEAKWHKPFLSSDQKSEEEMVDYIRCMTITQNVDQAVYYGLTDKNLNDIKDYMENPMTATWFNDKHNPKSKQKVVTAELIYCWMVMLGIPVEFEKWHLNRLLTLIRVCNIENSPKKKMGRNDILKQNSSLNQSRRRLMNSTG